MGYFSDLDLARRIGEPDPTARSRDLPCAKRTPPPVLTELTINLEFVYSNFSYKRRYKKFAATYQTFRRLRQISSRKDSDHESRM